MSDIPSIVTEFLLYFARVGACVMFLPGFSSERVLPRVRLFIALAATLAVFLMQSERILPSTDQPLLLARTIVIEVIVGASIGLAARISLEMLQFSAGLIAQSLGLNLISGSTVESTVPSATLVSLMTLTATTLIFVTDFHIVLLMVIMKSYDVLPLSIIPDPRELLMRIVSTLASASVIGLQLAAPFSIIGLLVNGSAALVNRFAPVIPSFFLAQPIVIVVGLLVLYWSAPTVFEVYVKMMFESMASR